MADRNSLESWESVIAGTIYLKRLDHRGELTRDEEIGAGRTIHLSPAERKINQEMAASEDLDPFRNGMLRPVRLLDGDEEAAELASNPNVMSETDMVSMFKAHYKTFNAKLSEIKNPYALQRLLDVALSAEVDATHSKIEAIKARLSEVSPTMVVERDSVPVVSGMSSGMRPVTPR